MKSAFALLFSLLITLPLHAENEDNGVTSPSARQVIQQVVSTQTAPTAVAPALPAATQALEGATPEEKMADLSKRERRIMQRLEKKLAKEKFRDAFGAHEAKAATFEDVITLAGAFVAVIGVLSIIWDPLSGIIVGLLGLLVYFLGRQAGGSINRIFR